MHTHTHTHLLAYQSKRLASLDGLTDIQVHLRHAGRMHTVKTAGFKKNDVVIIIQQHVYRRPGRKKKHVTYTFLTAVSQHSCFGGSTAVSQKLDLRFVSCFSLLCGSSTVFYLEQSGHQFIETVACRTSSGLSLFSVQL